MHESTMAPLPEADPVSQRTPAPDRAPPVRIRGIRKRYGPVTVLDNVALDVAGGEFITLLGASGSGKTTLLMVLAGFVRPDAGSVRVGGEEIITTPPHKRNVGMVFQNYALFPHMNVFNNVAFPLRRRRVGKAEIAERVRWALDLVQLADFAERRTDQLSGGQRQRVALARAIVFEPRILLMDEPLSALDKKLREHMQIELRRMHERLGMTTIYVTHDQREALTMSDRIAVIDHGQLVQLDSPRQLYEHPRTRFIAEFIGESSFLPVDFDGRHASFAGRPLKLAMKPDGNPGQRWLVVRPEKLSLVDGVVDPEALNLFEGTVIEVVYQGESLVCYVRLAGGGDLIVRNPTRAETFAHIPSAGEPIRLALSPEDTILVPWETS